mgnify:CR=1 FL=1
MERMTTTMTRSWTSKLSTGILRSRQGSAYKDRQRNAGLFFRQLVKETRWVPESEQGISLRNPMRLGLAEAGGAGTALTKHTLGIQSAASEHPEPQGARGSRMVVM